MSLESFIPNIKKSQDLYIYILVLCSCDVRLNQNLYVNSFFLLIYLKFDNKIDNKNESIFYF